MIIIYVTIGSFTKIGPLWLFSRTPYETRHKSAYILQISVFTYGLLLDNRYIISDTLVNVNAQIAWLSSIGILKRHVFLGCIKVLNGLTYSDFLYPRQTSIEQLYTVTLQGNCFAVPVWMTFT